MVVDWSLLETDEVAQRLDADLDVGLTDAEAARRLAVDGPNELVGRPPVPAWRRFVAQLQDPLIYLLLAAVVVSLVAWWVEGRHGWPFDALVIVVIVLVNAVLGYVQEARAASAVAALTSLSSTTAGVVRDGRQLRVPVADLVVGDLLVLGEGDAVGADARLVSAASLRMAEAPLTGESETVLKEVAALSEPAALGDRLDLVFSGTAVAQGVGRALVTATGMATEMGGIAGMIDAAVEQPTPLQREIARVGRMLGVAVVVIALVVMASVALTTDIDSGQELVTVLLLGVSLAVAAVPEGLPAILSVVLALGVQRMAEHRAIVKRLSSVEALGSASVICTDKTGTLTQNEMTVQAVVTASGEAAVTGHGYAPDGEVVVDGAALTDGPQYDEVVVVLSGGTLASTAAVVEEDGGWTAHGDPTEAAFLVAERKLGSDRWREERFSRVAVVPFTSDRKLMSSLEADAERDGKLAVITKGAPDVLLSRCTHRLVAGQERPLDDTARAQVLADVERLSDQAYRTLGVGFRRLDVTTPPAVDESVESGLVFAGMVGIIDPPRATASGAIEQAHRAGVRVIMITGDHPHTAARIASDLGIAPVGSPVLTGVALDALDDEGFAEAVRTVSVFARVSPAHKLRIVDALHADRTLVAMTGDGVNDAPALKAADIGVAMGRSGTEVAKEAAAMILADDDFATIVEAVREGRGIFANIRKFLRYLLSSNMGEVLTVFLGVVAAQALGLVDAAGSPVLPLLATQILWVNLLTDAAPALAMGVDPQTDDVMARPPRRITDRVIDAAMWRGVLLVGLVMALATLATVDLMLPGGFVDGDQTLTVARTAGFTVLVLAQLFNCFNARSETASAFSQLFTNRWLWAAIGLSLLLQVAVVHLPFLDRAFHTTPLTLDQWLLCTVMASTVLWVAEARKIARRLWRAGRRR